LKILNRGKQGSSSKVLSYPLDVLNQYQQRAAADWDWDRGTESSLDATAFWTCFTGEGLWAVHI